MVRTAATKSVGGKTSRKGLKNISTKPGGSTSDKGGNQVCPRDTPPWQQPISSFLTMGYKTEQHEIPEKENAMDIDQTSPSATTALKGFLDGSPVEVVVEVDVHVYDEQDGSPKKTSDRLDSEYEKVTNDHDINMEPVAEFAPETHAMKTPREEEEEDEHDSKRIKYDELVKHVHFLESLP